MKLDDRLRPGLVDAEASCLKLAREVGLTTVESGLETIADVRCLIVSRFDRRIEPDQGLVRIHQEDLCQALGRDPEAACGQGKYQDAGGPSLKELAGLLDRFGENSKLELDKLVAAVTFTVLIGNADAHGKNLALLHPTPERVELAPLYDTVPTALWPKLRKRGAMSINNCWLLGSITASDIAAEAALWRHDPVRSEVVALETAVRVRAAVDLLDPQSPVAEFVSSRTEKFLNSSRR